MTVKIATSAFDPFAEIQAHQATFGGGVTAVGANAVFVGSMRDFNDGEEVSSMKLEHYPGMTEKHLDKIAAEAVVRWGLHDALIVHRIGEVRPGEAIVLVAVWSAHRAHAFESCRHIMEDLKSSAPFWKKEQAKSGGRWVTSNTAGSSDELDQ